MAGIYPTSLAAAFPEKSRIDKAKADLEKAGVKYVFSCWIDILGSPKTKPVPVSEFERLCIGKGPQFAVHSVSMFPELGPADPDQIPIPDLDAIFVCPWNPEIAIVFADLYYEDAPYDVCPRMALKRTMQEAADAGYAFYAGMEPEFIVLRYDDQGAAGQSHRRRSGSRRRAPAKAPGLRLRRRILARTRCRSSPTSSSS